MNRINITGIGIVNSIAHNVSQFQNSMLDSKCGIKFVSDKQRYFAPVSDVDFLFYIDKYKSYSKEKIELTKRLMHREIYERQDTLLAVWEAVATSGVLNIENRRRVSVIVAGSNLFQGYTGSVYEKFTSRERFTVPRHALQYMDTYLMSLISEIFDVKGEGFSVGGASASGNVAITKGYQLIAAGVSDACIIVGSPLNWSEFEFMAFENLGAFGGKDKTTDPQSVCRPFDKNHDGFIPAQGAACIVLEKKSKDSDKYALGELCSAVTFIDGSSGSSPNFDGESDTITAAVETAGIEFCDIGYINAHGTSTPLGDITELDAINYVFGKRNLHPLVNSTKSLIGHCLNSAGIAEAIAVILQMNAGFIHGNRNLNDPINDAVYLVGKDAVNLNFNYALSNSFGFGGINSSVVIGRAQRDM